MKKITSAFLAVIMLLCICSFSAFAATQDNLNDASKEVKAKYLTGDRGASYSIDIAWGGLEFDFNANEVWDTANHKWVPGVTSWSLKNGSDNTITITNYSSVAIDAQFSFTKSQDFDDVGGSFTQNSLMLNTPANDPTQNEGSTTFTPTGTIPNTTSDYATIGTITITLGTIV